MKFYIVHFCIEKYSMKPVLLFSHENSNYKAYRSVSLWHELHLITYPCDQLQVYYSTRKQINRTAVSHAISVPFLTVYYLIFCVKIRENREQNQALPVFMML